MIADSIMIDLETMGTGPRAAIVSIGAFKFDLNTYQTWDQILYEQQFYSVIDLKSSMAAGLEVDAGCIEWWLNQNNAARASIQDGRSLQLALTMLTAFMNDRLYWIWGNGATFDNVILTSAFEAAKLPVPWGYKQNMCYRTMKAMIREVPFERVGIHHNALDDAISQGLHLQKIIQGTLK